MITNESYYKLDIYIPNVVNDAPEVNDVSNKTELQNAMSQYEREALQYLLGYNLYTEFSNQFDVDSDDIWTIKAGVDQKWLDLLNGTTYTIDDVEYTWKGLIYKDGNLDKSLLAYYVYYNFLSNDVEHYASIGIETENAQNATRVSAIAKAVKAWHNFYIQSVGNYNYPAYITNSSGCTGIDWFGSDDGVRSLYQYIRDINNQTPDTYENWKPKMFNDMNQFGL